MALPMTMTSNFARSASPAEAAGLARPGLGAGMGRESWRSKWDAAVQAERARSGRMEFLPVADSVGRITDLVCTMATPSVAQLLGTPEGELVGLRLRKLLTDHPDRGTLLPAYLGVATGGRASTCRTASLCGDERVFLLHDINRTAGLVVVVHLIPGRD